MFFAETLMTEYLNHYIQEGQKPSLTNSVVAFIDILGYKNLVKEAAESGKEENLLRKLHDALNDSSVFVKPDFILNDHTIRAFTDNIVLGYPISGHRKDAEIELILCSIYLSWFQLSMIHSGFFIRGGIAIGNLYMDDTVVYGKGLIEAYEAESCLARDPRIVLSVSAREAIDKHLGYYGGSYAPQADLYYRDNDGQYFLNYLKIVFHEDTGALRESWLYKHKEIIECMLNKWKKFPIILAKYFWAANYHNYFCSQHPQIEKSFNINLSDFTLLPAKINEQTT